MSETETETPTPEETETSDEENETAQPEEDEANEEGEPEPALEPEPAPQQDEERTEAFKKIDASFRTYQRNVEKQLSDEITDWIYCPLCASGAVPGYFNRHDLGRVPEEIVANVQTVLGFARETDYPAAKGINRCDACDGLGKVTTGSRVADHMTVTCTTCKGYGYTPPPGAAAVIGGPNGTPEAAVTEALADLEKPERDNWGEPRVLPDGTLNANYGKQPQFKEVHPVYGVTANLAPEELVSG